MTNKKFRDDLAVQMRNKYKERNEQLDQIDKMPISESVKESAKKDIMEAFYKEMEEFKKIPGYEKAKETHLREIQAKVGVNAARKEKIRLQKEYKENMAKIDMDIAEKDKLYQDAQVAHRGKIELYGSDSLRRDFSNLFNDLKENYVNIEKNVEYMGHKGKRVHIELPAIGDFNGFKFNYFLIDYSVPGENVKNSPEIEKKLYSKKEIAELLKALNRYFYAYGYDLDKDMDFENDLEFIMNKEKCPTSTTGHHLGGLTGLKDYYWLKGEDDKSLTLWDCETGCGFAPEAKGLVGKVLLKI